MTALWVAVIIAAVGSYGLKLAGVSLPESVLNHPRVQRIAGFLPIAMLSRWWPSSCSTTAAGTARTGGCSPASARE